MNLTFLPINKFSRWRDSLDHLLVRFLFKKGEVLQLKIVGINIYLWAR